MPHILPINGQPRPEPKRYAVLSVVVFTPVTVACACQQVMLSLKEPGAPVACPVCRRTYVVTGIRYDMKKSTPEKRAVAEVDVEAAEPLIASPLG
jgi:hypothetical protein